MPRTRKTTRPPNNPTEDLPVFVDSDPAEDSVSSIVEQFGPGDIQVKVMRQDQGKLVYCETLFNPNPADVNEETVRAMNYGAGNYILKIFLDGKFRTSVQMAIAAPANSPGARPDTYDSPILKMLMEQNARLEQRLLMQPARSEREPINDIADAMLKIHQMQAASPAAPGMTPETILQWIQLGKELGSGGGSDDSFMGLLKEIAPGAINAMIAGRNGGPADPPQQIAGPAQVQQEQERPVVNTSDVMLKAGIAYLKKKAIAGSDPGLYIDLIVDNREESLYAELIHGVLTKEFSAFIQVDESIGAEPFNAFFRAIYDGLRSAFKQDDPVEIPGGGKNGNEVHTSGNGASRKNGNR